MRIANDMCCDTWQAYSLVTQDEGRLDCQRPSGFAEARWQPGWPAGLPAGLDLQEALPRRRPWSGNLWARPCVYPYQLAGRRAPRAAEVHLGHTAPSGNGSGPPEGGPEDLWIPKEPWQLGGRAELPNPKISGWWPPNCAPIYNGTGSSGRPFPCSHMGRQMGRPNTTPRLPSQGFPSGEPRTGRFLQTGPTGRGPPDFEISQTGATGRRLPFSP